MSDCGRVSRCNSRILHSTVEHFLDHFDHVKKLAGVEHKGLIRPKYTDCEIELAVVGDFKRVSAQIWSVLPSRGRR
ncbi:MAG TPA: hypothetical protein VJZ77_24795 [Blastocatellia bacterium]|nr:hypothetical protein [Blastocatellia bacterium]